MVRCSPAEPSFTTTAERDVWEAIKRTLHKDDVLLSNLRLSDRKGDHEADLVVCIAGAGIVVVEVKGGSVSHDGQHWWQHGGCTKQIDPVRQARRTKYALRGYLDRDPRWARRRVRLAHAIAFPYSSVSSGFAVPDCPRAMVLDRDDLATNPAGLLRALALAQETDNPPPTLGDLDDLLDCLTGRMRPQRELLAEILDREHRVDLYTERQAAILTALRRLDRVEVLGSAGTGKTWLAIEQARRLTAEGQRVALTCYSRGLADYLSRRVHQLLPDERPAYVGTFHGLGVSWGAPEGSDDDSAFSESELPARMVSLAQALPQAARFDAVIVDEAQDFSDSWWPAVLSALRDEDAGGLFVFSDEGQRVFARKGNGPVSLLPVLLDENLRNTRPIAATFGSLAPPRLRYRGGDGEPVRLVESATDDAVRTADDCVEALLEEGWPPGSVALLTTGRRHPEQVARQASGHSSYWESYYDGDQVFYGHVLGFKGLERPAVVLAVNGFGTDERAREKLYVGLSRARDNLVVCGDPALLHAIGGEAVMRRLRGG